MDSELICVGAFLRSTTVGFLGVVLAIYLSEAQFSVATIGMIIGAGLAGTATATVLIGAYGDAFGRRRTLIALSALTAAGYAGLALAPSRDAVLAVAFFGMLNGMGRDRGAATTLDQAVLPATTTPEKRTWSLARYNLVLDAGHAVGALASATPALLASAVLADPLNTYRASFLICAGAMVATVVIYAGLSDRVEVETPAIHPERPRRLTPRSRRFVTRLALLFGLDSLGGGFLNSALISYWFFRRYGTSETDLALIFFAARALNAASHVAAAWVARRIGLVNTMVFTHLPSSLFLMTAPFAPSGAVAAALFLAREALVEMDVPTRQSYVMAIVQPDERTLASAATNVTRTASWAVGASAAGTVMAHLAFSSPLFFGGAMKIAYDLLLYRSFRRIRPPEEREIDRGAISCVQ